MTVEKFSYILPDFKKKFKRFQNFSSIYRENVRNCYKRCCYQIRTFKNSLQLLNLVSGKKGSETFEFWVGDEGRVRYKLIPLRVLRQILPISAYAVLLFLLRHTSETSKGLRRLLTLPRSCQLAILFLSFLSEAPNSTDNSCFSSLSMSGDHSD